MNIYKHSCKVSRGWLPDLYLTYEGENKRDYPIQMGPQKKIKHG